MTANLAKTSTNANGNVTIGHYILGKSNQAPIRVVVELCKFREGAWQGNFRPCEAGHSRFDRRKGNLHQTTFILF